MLFVSETAGYHSISSSELPLPTDSTASRAVRGEVVRLLEIGLEIVWDDDSRNVNVKWDNGIAE